MSTDKVWYNTGSSYYHRTKAEQHDKLPVGVYTLDWNDEERCFYLNRLQDRYTFDYKLYDFDANFVKRVGKTYQKKKGNLGVLLCGTKGCGKTVTAKQICNLYMSDFSVPIILITVAHNGIPEFIGEIHQDVLILIDEYEKIFTPHNGSDGYLLSLMDGALSNNFRRTFILTANYTQDINDNLMQRTGRILYLKKYDELGIDVIREIVHDKLENKEREKEVVDFISMLDLITVDIVCALVEEVNIHDESPVEFFEFFNVEKKRPNLSVFKVNQDGSEDKCKISHSNFLSSYSEADVGDTFGNIGYIKEVLGPTSVMVGMSEEEDTWSNYRVEATAAINKAFKNATPSKVKR